MQVGRLGCLFGFHHRSRSAVVNSSGLARSVCRHCHQPMVKDGDNWRRAQAGELGGR